MAQDSIHELDVVALTQDVPDLGLREGAVGTIVHVYDGSTFEVEFVASSGKTYALTTLNASALLLLHWEPACL